MAGELLPKLEQILGAEGLKSIAVLEAGDDGQTNNECLTNAKDIYCNCKTLILRPNHARIVLADDSMLKIENELKLFQNSDKFPNNIIRGCYWLVDDMYKFEQMGYTREVSAQSLNIRSENPQSSTNEAELVEQPELPDFSNLKGLRYLICAECNLCPLGWFEPTTKESFLYVWKDKEL